MAGAAMMQVAWIVYARLSDRSYRVTLVPNADSAGIARDVALYDMPRRDTDRIVEMRLVWVADMVPLSLLDDRLVRPNDDPDVKSVR